MFDSRCGLDDSLSARVMHGMNVLCLCWICTLHPNQILQFWHLAEQRRYLHGTTPFLLNLMMFVHFEVSFFLHELCCSLICILASCHSLCTGSCCMPRELLGPTGLPDRQALAVTVTSAIQAVGNLLLCLSLGAH
jgi:hypothetical protein